MFATRNIAAFAFAVAALALLGAEDVAAFHVVQVNYDAQGKGNDEPHRVIGRSIGEDEVAGDRIRQWVKSDVELALLRRVFGRKNFNKNECSATTSPLELQLSTLADSAVLDVDSVVVDGRPLTSLPEPEVKEVRVRSHLRSAILDRTPFPAALDEVDIDSLTTQISCLSEERTDVSPMRKIYLDLLMETNNAFPQYVRELKAMANAAGVDEEDLLLSNFREELLQLVPDDEMENVRRLRGSGHADDNEFVSTEKRRKSSRACTDVYIRSKNFAGYAHNDDWGTSLPKGLGYIVEVYSYNHGFEAVDAEFKGGFVNLSMNDSRFEWTSFVYPGYLPGMDYSMTRRGLTMTVNSLFPKYYLTGKGHSPVYSNGSGVGTAFISRRALEAKDLRDMINIVSDARASTALSYNLGQVKLDEEMRKAADLCSVKDAAMVNVEVGFTLNEVTHVVEHVHLATWMRDDKYTSGFHANRYEGLSGVVTDLGDTSSDHRLITFSSEYANKGGPLSDTRLANEGYSPSKVRRAMLQFLSDQSDPEYPVYRDAEFSKKDQVNTEATGMFDLNEGTLELWDKKVLEFDASDLPVSSIFRRLPELAEPVPAPVNTFDLRKLLTDPKPSGGGFNGGGGSGGFGLDLSLDDPFRKSRADEQDESQDDPLRKVDFSAYANMFTFGQDFRRAGAQISEGMARVDDQIKRYESRSVQRRDDEDEAVVAGLPA